MPTRENGYTVVTGQDPEGDNCQLVMRESTLPTGLLKVEELARVSYGDIHEANFPDGLIEPTAEDIARFGGKPATEKDASISDVSKYEPSVNIAEITQRITVFVLDGIQSGRQPVIAWNDEATPEEVEAFHEAVAQVQKEQNSVQDSNSEQNESFGLYL